MITRIFTFFLAIIISISISQGQNNALSFDGTDDNIITPDLYSSYNGTSRTIELWFNASSKGVILNEQGSTTLDGGWFDSQIEILSSGEVMVSVWTGGATSVSVGTVSFNTWNHVALCYDHAAQIVYGVLNGIASSSQSASIQMPSTSHLYYRLAAYTATNLGSDAWFSGKLDEVRFWNDIRTNEEIRSKMYTELSNPASETNLITYYKLNETSGTTANDESSNDFHGTLSGMSGTEWIASPAFFGPKYALSFNGTDNYVELADGVVNSISEGSEISLECWYKGTDFESAIRLQPIGDDFIVLGWKLGDGIQALVSTDGSTNGLPFQGTIEDNKWHHIAMTWQKNTVNGFKVYIDGRLDNERTTSNVNLPVLNTGAYLGLYILTPGEFLTGSLDEVRIWNDVRTEQEIRENMNKALTGNESGLVAYYNFDNTSGTTLQDLSGNAYDGTLIDDPTWVSSSAFNTWLNTDDSNWSTASNWSRGSVPGSSDNVHIENLNNVPSNSADLTVNNLMIASNSPLDFTGNLITNGNAFFYSPYTIHTGDGMTVNGDFFFDDSKSMPFTIESGGSLITMGDVSGSLNIEKSIAESGKWHLISTPNDNTTTSDFINYFLQEWDEPSASWVEVTETGLAMSPGKGYSFYDTPDTKTTFSFSGVPNTGEIFYELNSTASGDESEGMNLVGNPYPSSIDWNVLNETYGAVYIWNPSSNDYIEWNGESEFGLAPMQGFFIWMNPGKSLFFMVDNDARTHNSASNFYKSTSYNIENGIILSTNQQDQLTIKFVNDAYEEFDFNYDAFKIVSLGEGNSQIYSKYFDTKLAIDCRPETDIIQLGYQNNLNGTYTIEMIESDDVTAELEDTKLNQFHDLTKGAYTFNWQTTDSEERFVLHLKATGTDDWEEQEGQAYVANRRIYIQQNATSSYHKISVYDMTGRLLAEYPLAMQNLQSFELNQASGAYLIQLVGKDKSLTEKVILD